MGLFDKLLDRGAKALGDAVSSATALNEQDTWEEPGSRRGMFGHGKKSRVPKKSFEEKLQDILQNAGNYELRKSISPDELEQEFGREIYARGGCYCKPENITYGIYQGDNRVLMIRLWWDYAMYRRVANRQIKQYCDANGVRMLDFFEYLPNEEDYMEQRIREQLV